MVALRKIGFFLGLFIVLGALLLIGSVFYEFKYAPLLKKPRAEVVTIKIFPGTGTDYLISDLHQQGLIRFPGLWRSFSFISNLTQRFKAGEYEIKPGMSFSKLLNNIVRGRVYNRKLVVIEGWTYKNLLRILQKNTVLQHVLNPQNQSEVMALLGSKEPRPEGMFFPDTYFYTWGNSDLEVLRYAYKKMQRVLIRAWNERADDVPYKDPYEALIVASLIEKETAQASERPIIASVILNRLQKNMPLQIDPTVSYGLGDARMKLKLSHLKLYTVYNTYLLRGLPPTPISLPGKACIEAAMHPMQTQYLYYVSRGDGSHQFSETYTQHLEGVNKYIRSKPNMTLLREERFPFEGILQLRSMVVNKHFCERTWKQNVAISSR